jgi:serine/threonine protein kinase
MTPTNPDDHTLPPAPPASPSALPERSLVTDYEILGELGCGGMGVVYKARQVALDRVVALKMVRDADLAGAEQVARFRREAEAIGRLKHPNVVQIYAVGELQGRPYFSLEYADGGSLAHLLAGQVLPQDQAADLVRTLALAVQAAHETGVLHRDLKPANVLLMSPSARPSAEPCCVLFGRRFVPKITDFGLARLVDREMAQTQSGEVLGTPGYMAPEQADGRGKHSTAATDVYALGAILYELLTGRPPFQAATYLDTLIQVLTEEPPSLRLFRPDLARDLETVCQKCLHKDPQRRYATAADLTADLGRFLAGQPIRARPLGLPEEFALLRESRPSLAVVLGTVAFLVGFVVCAAGVTALTERKPAAATVALVFSVFIAGVLVALRPGVRTLLWGGLIAGPAGLLAGRDPSAAVVGLTVGAGLATWFGGLAQALSRYWGRPILETLAGLMTGAIGGLVLASPLADSLTLSTVGRPVAVLASAAAAGSVLFGAALAAWLNRLDRRRALRTGKPPAPADTRPERSPPPPVPVSGKNDVVLPQNPEGAPLPAVTDPNRTAVHVPPAPPAEADDTLPRVSGYLVEGTLGKGGMAVVYRARQLAADRVVALKMIRAGWAAAPTAWERFQREARAVARLSHPNIVQVYEMGVADGQPYLALQLMPGGSLAARLRGRPFPARQAAELVQTLAHAIQEAHQQKVVHRDLKPHNVLLGEGGVPKIADFGLARLEDEGTGLTRTGDVLGTPGYMAPEQAEGRLDKVGPAADVYALGAILYEMLTGRPPFRAANHLATLEQIRTQAPLPPRRFQPACPRDLEAVCLKCLEKEPARRYASAADLADDLGRSLAGEPTHARPPALWRRALSTHVRIPSLFREPVTVGEILASGLVVGAVVASGLIRPDSICLQVCIVALLLTLFSWRRASRKPPRPVLSRPLAWDEAAPVAPVRTGRTGWVTFPLSRLRFPAGCSGCGQPTGGFELCRISDRVHRLELLVPYCPACQTAERRRRWLGLGLGAAVVSAALFWLVFSPEDYRELGAVSLLAPAQLTAAIAGAVAGAALGWAAARRKPVRWRRYSWSKATVDLRFRRREYAAEVVAWVERQEPAGG